ncbi:unnamed protein product [Boreogadus saida]
MSVGCCGDKVSKRHEMEAARTGGGKWTVSRREENMMTTLRADRPPLAPLEVDVDLGFALFFLFLLCFFLLVTIVRCAQTVVDPYGSISTSGYQEEQIT